MPAKENENSSSSRQTQPGGRLRNNVTGQPFRLNIIDLRNREQAVIDANIVQAAGESRIPFRIIAKE
jgi:hypothetical protein